MDILRKAAKPMTACEIADAMAEQCGLAPMPPEKHKALLTKVRNMLARQDGRTVAREEQLDGAVWRVA